MERYRIGLMVGNKSISYAHAIRMGLQNTLEDAGHTLVAISDLIPFHTRENAASYFRVAFEVAARLDLDAIVVPAGIISGYLQNNQESLDSLLGILNQRKTLVIEREIAGYRCVGKDNVSGMRECMHHLIERCGFKKIAFIAGPEQSKGSQERESIYREEMAAHGLDVPASMFAHGDFSGECEDVIERIIDSNPGLEAIACCCDLTAHTTYRVMRQKGLLVGSDIAVTGFDDQEHSAYLNPPLSTVHMTGYDLGCMAAREAIRLCEGKPQEERMLSSTFVARRSCGEKTHDTKDLFVQLLRQSPFPMKRIVRELVSYTLPMAGRRISKDFEGAMERFVRKACDTYWNHTIQEDSKEPLFSSQDIGLLYHRDYREAISVEGFRTTMLALLQALTEVSSLSDTSWVIEQIANLHLGIARVVDNASQEEQLAMRRREWTSLHIVDDVLRESMDPVGAYKLILQDFLNLGILKADLYLLPNPVVFIGSRTFALSDSLMPIGSLQDGQIVLPRTNQPVALQELLGRLVPSHHPSSAYTVGGVMAGNELVGIAAFDAGKLNCDEQLIAFLSLGAALKHLQMLAAERETNELLSKSNLILRRESHYDEMTGVLNRRGFMANLEQMLERHIGDTGTLYFFDLDGLKCINDTFGHDSGDEAICQTTRILRECLPPHGILGRLGGDEFVTFTLWEDEKITGALGKSVDAAMARFNATRSTPYELSISYGGVLVSIEPFTYERIDQVMMKADERLYEMKKHHPHRRR